ncbi:MAG: phosphoglycerate kinase [Candidatus Brockarchaeota archaeon]|nr:phosphoglycerate kinase [Candidatus Brockarchaeota archaeon]
MISSLQRIKGGGERFSRLIPMWENWRSVEEEAFAKGTIELYKAAASSKAFTVVGGGHSISALEKAGVYDKIGFVSTAGGALISYLSDEKLPGVEALKTQ